MSTIVDCGNLKIRVPNPRLKVTDIAEYDVCTVGDKHFRIIHEFSDTTKGFAHRLRYGNKTGQWQSYQGIAELRYASREFRGVTQYFSVDQQVYHVVPGKLISTRGL